MVAARRYYLPDSPHFDCPTENRVAPENIELPRLAAYASTAMFDVLFPFLSSFRVHFQRSSDTQLEIVALRHRITVLERKIPKPRLKSADRRLWVFLSRFWSRWRSALVLVTPDTVIDWHRRGFRWCWTWKVCHGKAGRPSIPKNARELIRTMNRNNVFLPNQSEMLVAPKIADRSARGRNSGTIHNSPGTAPIPINWRPEVISLVGRASVGDASRSSVAKPQRIVSASFTHDAVDRSTVFFNGPHADAGNFEKLVCRCGTCAGDLRHGFVGQNAKGRDAKASRFFQAPGAQRFFRCGRPRELAASVPVWPSSSSGVFALWAFPFPSSQNESAYLLRRTDLPASDSPSGKGSPFHPFQRTHPNMRTRPARAMPPSTSSKVSRISFIAWI